MKREVEIMRRIQKEVQEDVKKRQALEFGKEPNAVEHPAHYGGENNPYEAIKIIEALDFNFNLGNAFKYLARAGKKDPTKALEDLRKGAWYLNREIENRSKPK